MEPDDDAEDELYEDHDDVSDMRRRTFLERHDWIPWMAAAILIGGIAGFLPEHWLPWR